MLSGRQTAGIKDIIPDGRDSRPLFFSISLSHSKVISSRYSTYRIHSTYNISSSSWWRCRRPTKWTPCTWTRHSVPAEDGSAGSPGDASEGHCWSRDPDWHDFSGYRTPEAGSRGSTGRWAPGSGCGTTWPLGPRLCYCFPGHTNSPRRCSVLSRSEPWRARPGQRCGLLVLLKKNTKLCQLLQRNK